ncbi:hypothetical protein PQO01_08530 [Lentisphaera marina]|uniref:hypothetical protein n=1 Tax=Lentisphaera marina TaxID=1111041 RepID=UPI002366A5B9|nr:hypothetical protein [Lentisphaera marina]MDD7984990.1 hypothetical protein [Lentisphaera marina]
MSRKFTQLVILLFSFMCIAQAQSNNFLGEWKNSNPTRGITRLIISQDKGAWHVQAWGKCHPRDCDWGKTELKLLGDSITDKSAKYAFAYWDKDFVDSYITLRFDKGVLVAEVFKCFKDKSKRLDYRSVYTLKKH